MAMENTPRRKARKQRQRRRQEERWAAKSGPVTVRRVDDPKPDSSAEVADNSGDKSAGPDKERPRRD